MMGVESDQWLPGTRKEHVTTSGQIAQGRFL